MKKLITKQDLFNGVTRLVDVCAIAFVAINSPTIVGIKQYLELSDEEVSLILKELENFFGDSHEE